MKFKILTGIGILVLAFGVIAYAAGDAVEQWVAETKSDALLQKAIAAEQAEMAVQEDAQLVNEIGVHNARTSKKDFLRSKGYYEDEINRAMKKHVRSVVLFGLSDAENDYILSLVDQGYDYERLMEIYQFLALTNDDLTLMKQIYDMSAPAFEVEHWIENAYESIKNIQSLKFEDVATYVNQGISIDEILFAYQLSLRGNCTERQILDERKNGASWVQLAQDAGEWGTMQLSAAAEELDVSAVSNIVNMARITRRSPSELLDIGETVMIKQEAAEQVKKVLERVDMLNQQLELEADTSPVILEHAAQIVPELDRVTLEKLVGQGYRVREIQKAVQENTNDKQSQEIQSAIAAANDQEVAK